MSRSPRFASTFGPRLVAPLLAGGLLLWLVLAGPRAVGPARAAPAAPASSSSASPKASAASGASSSGGKAGDATGKLNREEFEKALSVVLFDLNGCYKQSLKQDAIAEGTVVLVLETAGGKVLKAETDRAVSTMKLDAAHACIVSVVKKMRLPIAKNAAGQHDPKARAVVRYPVEFSLGIDVGAGPAKEAGASLDRDKIKSLFFVNKIEFGRCILDARKALKGDKAAGKLVLEIGVVGGAVTSVAALPETTVEDATFKACVQGAVKKLVFPLPKDGKGNDDPKAPSTIVYPMEFAG